MSAVITTECPLSFNDSKLSWASPVKLFKGMSTGETAIKVEHVWKKYDDQQTVLRNFNMTVLRGSIYALLGSSGCGKTTILCCIVGRQTWDLGTISVLASSPSTKPCDFLDRRRIGFMPQELALQDRMTIKELLILYGRLCDMNIGDIMARYEFLQGFLQLPRENKIVANLSIWQYLQDLVAKLKITIVLTTHYVDEARRSNVIGLMRNGRIITEESPYELMRQYGSSSLDQIVLQICKRDEASKKISRNGNVVGSNQQPISNNFLITTKGKLGRTHSQPQVIMESGEESVKYLNYRPSIDCEDIPPISQHDSFSTTFGKRARKMSRSKNESSTLLRWERKIIGMIWANIITIFRHTGFLPMGLMMPPLTIALAQYVFGSDLHGLRFGYVINDEPSTNLSVIKAGNLQGENCLDSKFSYLFLERIPLDSLDLVPFPDKSKALDAVKTGNIWGFVNIPTNYTGYIQNRMLSRHFSDIETLNGSVIGIHLDMSSSVLVLKKLFQAFNEFLEGLAHSCGLPSEELEMPLKFNTPVYGDLDGSYTTQVVPGILLFLLFALPLSGISVFLIQDRNAGYLDRMRITGVSYWDIVLTTFATSGAIQMFKILLCTLILLYGFSYTIKGSILLYVIVMICNSASGMALGFLLAQICSNEIQALIAIFFTAVFLIPFSGVFWPVEGLQYGWKIIAYCLPTTLASQSFRSVVFRGVSFTHALVWPGVAVSILWIAGSLIVTFFMFRSSL